MIKPIILAPSLIEPGSSVELDGSRSYDSDDPFARLTLTWTQVEGPAGQLELSAGKVIVTAPDDIAPGEAFVVRLTAINPATSQSATAEATMTCVQLISSEMITLSAAVPAGLTIMPRGSWSFDVELTAKDGTAVLRSLCPDRLFTRMAVGSSIAMVPTVVHRRWLDSWRVYVQPAAAGETALKLLTEQVRAEVPEEGSPALVLRRPALQILSIVWQRNDGTDERIEVPWTTHKSGSVVIFLSELLRARFEQGQDGLFQVRYYAQDYIEHAGWYAGLGLGPSDVADATLLVAYGAGPYVDPGLDVSGTPWNIGYEAHWSAPVRLAGRLQLSPYYHIWKREQGQALLREPYQGIVRE